MALGTASTGPAIVSLSGAAATNATLAALGGGALAAGGGGVALGTAVLGGATLGVGLLVGGIIFNVTGSKISDKADEAYSQACDTRYKVGKICDYLQELSSYAAKYLETLKKVEAVYSKKLVELEKLVFQETNWNRYHTQQKKLVENTVLLVGLLNKMCKVRLVLRDTDNNDLNEVNKKEVDSSVNEGLKILSDVS